MFRLQRVTLHALLLSLALALALALEAHLTPWSEVVLRRENFRVDSPKDTYAF